ncbi:protein of unknown function [Micropruina glycogenica]|uniref:Uncharacterized protein n=1 Tax=Micropruina glycogenica TaxID=75385 RepID=A0A2N9JJW4_9ACTN|nr:protein of unknown function [Micropruina glycogenica]
MPPKPPDSDGLDDRVRPLGAARRQGARPPSGGGNTGSTREASDWDSFVRATPVSGRVRSRPALVGLGRDLRWVGLGQDLRRSGF